MVICCREKLQQNIDALLSADTFTVTTAHQPNILTGPLYFIYKILHAIKLAEHLKSFFTSIQFCSRLLYGFRRCRPG